MWLLFVVLGPFAIVPLAFLLFLKLFELMIILTFEVVPKALVWVWRGAEEREQERARLIHEREQERARLIHEREQERARLIHERERWAQGTPRDRVLYEALRREREQGFLDVHRYRQELARLDAQDFDADHIETSEEPSRGP